MTTDFLQLAGKRILVVGVANRRSVATHIARVLQEACATVIFSVRSAERAAAVKKLFGEASEVHVCDVEHQAQIDALAAAVAQGGEPLHGLVHSIAFANYSDGLKPFHEVLRDDFLQAVNVSCYSLMALCNALRPSLDRDASVVTISISTTTMAAENYGYMAPVKAALDSAIVFLARSFSTFSRVRFNAVSPGLLKTSASAGIPGYLDSYLFAEQATFRKEGVRTDEVANTAAFLLSPRSSGITAQHLIVDAGMYANYFDPALVRRVVAAPKDADAT
ncbi:MAG: enoyl-ACP reductase [Planctomycetota bacterium]